MHGRFTKLPWLCIFYDFLWRQDPKEAEMHKWLNDIDDGRGALLQSPVEKSWVYFFQNFVGQVDPEGESAYDFPHVACSIV